MRRNTLTTHSPGLARRSFGILVTPSSHASHHSRDARYVGKNFGAMFTIWDRVFGTLCEHDSKSPLFYDVPSNRRTHDGIATQWRLIVELAIKLRTTRSSRERLSLLFGRPAVEVSAQAFTADVALDRASKRALTIAFTLIVIASTWLLWSRDSLPKPPVYFFALALLVAMHAIGRFMNRQRRESPARTEEIAID